MNQDMRELLEVLATILGAFAIILGLSLMVALLLPRRAPIPCREAPEHQETLYIPNPFAGEYDDFFIRQTVTMPKHWEGDCLAR